MPLGLLIVLTVAAIMFTALLPKLPGDPQFKSLAVWAIIFVFVILWLVFLLNFIGIPTGGVGRSVNQ